MPRGTRMWPNRLERISRSNSKLSRVVEPPVFSARNAPSPHKRCALRVSPHLLAWRGAGTYNTGFDGR